MSISMPMPMPMPSSEASASSRPLPPWPVSPASCSESSPEATSSNPQRSPASSLALTLAPMTPSVPLHSTRCPDAPLQNRYPGSRRRFHRFHREDDEDTDHDHHEKGATMVGIRPRRLAFGDDDELGSEHEHERRGTVGARRNWTDPRPQHPQLPNGKGVVSSRLRSQPCSGSATTERIKHKKHSDSKGATTTIRVCSIHWMGVVPMTHTWHSVVIIVIHEKGWQGDRDVFLYDRVVYNSSCGPYCSVGKTACTIHRCVGYSMSCILSERTDPRIL
jgi:hypothetical protein